MTIPNNKKSQYSPYGLARNSVTVSNEPKITVKELKKLEALLACPTVKELEALLTCPQDTVFFKRFTRTMILLKKEPSLRKLWISAVVKNKRIKAEREQMLADFRKHSEALRLDVAISSLSIIYESTNRDGARLLPEGEWKVSSRLAVPIEFSDLWIGEVATWLISQQVDPTTSRGLKLMELRQCICKWEEANRRWYPIGDHPRYSLARLIHLEEWIESFLEDSGLYEPPSQYFEPRAHILWQTLVREIRGKVEETVENLIAEIPIIKSWGERAVSALAWQTIVYRKLLQIQGDDRRNGTVTNAEDIAKKLWPEVKKYRITPGTVTKFVKTVGFRTRKESKRAQQRRKLKADN
jgi:hypothetical protein